jgi:hypothetical protein
MSWIKLDHPGCLFDVYTLTLQTSELERGVLMTGAAAGALINKSTSGTVTLSGLTLDGLIPSNDDS